MGVTIDGQEAGSQTQTEFGELVHTAVAQAPPGGSTTVEFTLEGTVEPGAYRLDVLPQPMTEPDQLNLRIDDGHRTTEFVGDLDRTLRFGPDDVPADGPTPDVDTGLLVGLVAVGLSAWFVARRREAL